MRATASLRCNEQGGGTLAGAEGNVVIRAGKCAVAVLPGLGGKISSLIVDGHELLQAPLKPYGPRSGTMAFSDGDASGWDECLPSVAACSVVTAAGTVAVADHGDLWRVPWRVVSASTNSVVMAGECLSLPLKLTRSLTVSEAGDGWELQVLYTLTNRGDFEVPWLWSAHPSFAVEAGDRILLPAHISSLLIEGSAGDRLGVAGEVISWPTAKLGDGSEWELDRAARSSAGTGDKLFAGPFVPPMPGLGASPGDSWCRLDRAGPGLSLTMTFDAALTPYLGLWICYGGWPPGDGSKQMCVAIEPTTSPRDSLAAKGPWSRTIGAGAVVSWPMNLRIRSIINH